MIFAFLIELPLTWPISSFLSYFLPPLSCWGREWCSCWVSVRHLRPFSSEVHYPHWSISCRNFLPSCNNVFLSLWAPRIRHFCLDLHLYIFKDLEWKGRQKITYTITREEQWHPQLFWQTCFSLTQSTCFNSGLPQINHAPFLSGRKGDNS